MEKWGEGGARMKPTREVGCGGAAVLEERQGMGRVSGKESWEGGMRERDGREGWWGRPAGGRAGAVWREGGMRVMESAGEGKREKGSEASGEG